MPKSPLQKLYTDHAHIAVARAVRYHTLPCSEVIENLKEALAAHGREKLDAAAKDLLIIEGTYPNTTARLKDEVRGLCWGLLGPTPEKWDEFYEGIENAPPNPYRTKAPDVKPLADSRAPDPIQSSNDASTSCSGDDDIAPRRMTPAEMTSEEMIRKLDDVELQNLLDDARAGLNHHGPKSRHGRQLQRDIAMAEAEIARRRAEAGKPSEVDLIRSMHGSKLRKLLLAEHAHFRDYPPGHHFHAEALRRMDLLEAEMRRRGNKVPTRPMPPPLATSPREERVSQLEGTELMKRYFKAKEILETESEHTGVWKQTMIEYDLLKAECLRRDIALPPTGYDHPAWEFRRHTTHRLKELLDMSQYEVAKYDPETVTHQEAARDIGFIEAELRRRHW